MSCSCVDDDDLIKGVFLIVKLTLPNFKTSGCWVKKFLAKNNLVLQAKTSIAVTLPSDFEYKVAQFCQNITYNIM